MSPTSPDVAPTWLERLGASLGLRAAERERALLLFAYQAAIVAALIVGRTARDTLFLARRGRDELPWIYVGVSACVALATLGYTRLTRGISMTRATLRTLELLAAAFVAAFAITALGLMPAPGYAALYVLVEIAAALLMMQFWTVAHEVFSAREAKRLFGFVGGGGVAAQIACGAAMGPVADALGTEALLLGVAGALVAARWFASRVGRDLHAARASLVPTRVLPTREPAVAPPVGPHVHNLALLVAATMLVSTLVDFQFKVVARDHFHGDEAALAAYFGRFYAIAGVVSAAAQFLAIGRVLEAYGLTAALAVLPATFALGEAWLVLGHVAGLGAALAATTIAKGADNVLRYTLNDAALQLLYAPVGRAVRARAKAIVDGVTKPVSVGVAGLVVLLVGRALAGGDASLVPWTAGIALALLAVWGVAVWRARRTYVGALLDTLTERRLLDLDVAPRLASDELARRTLRSALASAEEDVVLDALELAPSLGLALDDELPRLRRHASPRVRAVSLERSLGRPTARPTHAAGVELPPLRPTDPQLTLLGEALVDDDLRVQGVAQQFIAALAPVDARATLLQLRGTVGDAPALARLRVQLGDTEQTSSTDPTLRLAAALADPSADVRAAALEAAAARGTAILVPTLLARLESEPSPELRRRILGALTPHVAEHEDTLVDIVARAPLDRLATLRLVAEHGRGRAIEPLLDLLSASELERRLAAARTLSRLGERLGVTLDDARIAAASESALEDAERTLALERTIGPSAEGLLAEALEQRGRRLLVLSLELAATRPGAAPLRAVARQLERRERPSANVVELLDNLLPRQTFERVLPLCDPTERTRAVEVSRGSWEPNDVDGALLGLITHADPWLRTTALWEARLRGRTRVLEQSARAIVGLGSGLMADVTRETLEVVRGEG
jgi:ATP/ADP translocase